MLFFLFNKNHARYVALLLRIMWKDCLLCQWNIDLVKRKLVAGNISQ